MQAGSSYSVGLRHPDVSRRPKMDAAKSRGLHAPVVCAQGRGVLLTIECKEERLGYGSNVPSTSSSMPSASWRHFQAPPCGT